MKRFLVMLLIVTTTFVQAQSKVNGVITYFFNQYQGDKPDIGSKVIAIDSLNTGIFNNEVYEKYHYGGFYFRLAKSTDGIIKNYQNLVDATKKKKKDQDENTKYQARLDSALGDQAKYLEEAKRYSVSSEEDLDILDKQLAPMVLFPKETIIVSETTVDGAGRYFLDLKPGTYYILIKSKNRTGLTMSEVMGQVYVKKIKVGPSQTKDVSHNFTMN